MGKTRNFGVKKAVILKKDGVLKSRVFFLKRWGFLEGRGF